ncbi:c-type cytochrome [Prosthecomicrobium sp. N25]|uniref:c-type cytochrome n=1 Tax=Prosthecomicrobium sp. N25 TaxID=3129254 RepID=UPI003077D5E9
MGGRFTPSRAVPGFLALTAAFAAAAALAATPALADVGQGDPEAGRVVFEQCAKCHALGDKPAEVNAGPPLDGVIGRRAASVQGFTYSPQLRSSRITWDEAYLARFIKSPKSLIPGTRMQFGGLGTDQEVADVIAFLARAAAQPKPQ